MKPACIAYHRLWNRVGLVRIREVERLNGEPEIRAAHTLARAEAMNVFTNQCYCENTKLGGTGDSYIEIEALKYIRQALR
jgi:hypothetical protein